VADPYVPFIIETLTKYPRLCASRVFEMVRERGYPGGPDHFRRVVARLRPHPPAEAFLRQRTLPGDAACVGRTTPYVAKGKRGRGRPKKKAT
jgi:transposase